MSFINFHKKYHIWRFIPQHSALDRGAGVWYNQRRRRIEYYPTEGDMKKFKYDLIKSDRRTISLQIKNGEITTAEAAKELMRYLRMVKFE